MNGRLQRLGIGLVFIGIAFFAAGGYTLIKTQQGAHALQTFSAAQNVKLSYNDQGQLLDRGETAGADKIMSLLVNDWGFAGRQGRAQPERPARQHRQRVHVPDGRHQLSHPARRHDRHLPRGCHRRRQRSSRRPAPTTSRTTARYWTGFDRTNPIEGAAREKIWTGTAHALVANLGVGSVTASALTMGLGIAALFALVGATVVLTGLGLVWATRAATEKVKAPAFKPAVNPA